MGGSIGPDADLVSRAAFRCAAFAKFGSEPDSAFVDRFGMTMSWLVGSCRSIGRKSLDLNARELEPPLPGEPDFFGLKEL